MATFHGEILPVVSRAVDEGAEENAPLPRTLVLEWNKDRHDEQLVCDTLIITVGEVARRFWDIYIHGSLDDSSKIVSIKELQDTNEDNFEEVSQQQKVVSRVYQFNNAGKRIICATCNFYIPPEQIWPWTKQFFGFVKPLQDVFILTSSTIHEYKCENMRVELPFVRSLSTTTKPKSHPVFPALEQPNMLKNIPAAVISYCQFHDIPAVAYICYTENLCVDLNSVKAFIKLCDTSQFKENEDYEEMNIKKVEAVRNCNMGSGLYT